MTRCAASVGRTCNPARLKSGLPRYCSSSFICMLTALGVRFMTAAAAANEPSERTAASVWKASSLIKIPYARSEIKSLLLTIRRAYTFFKRADAMHRSMPAQDFNIRRHSFMDTFKPVPWLAAEAERDTSWIQRLSAEEVAGFDAALAHAKTVG